MGQCYGKPDPQLIQRTGEAPLPFVQVDPVQALLPPPSLVKLPPQQYSLAGAGGAVAGCSTEPVVVMNYGAFKMAQPCIEPAKKSKGSQRRPVPPPKPTRSTQTKLSTAAALCQEAGVEATINQASVDNLHHHSMDEGYGTMDRADGTLHSRVCSPSIPPTTVRSAPIQRMDVVPSSDDTTNKDKDFVPMQLVSKPESQIAYSTVVSKPPIAYNSAVSSGLKPEPPLAYSTTRAEYKLRWSSMFNPHVPPTDNNRYHARRSSISTGLGHQGQGYESDSPAVRRTAPIQRKEVPYTMPVPAPTVSSVHIPSSRKDMVPNTNTHADNRYRTLERSRFYQQLLMSRSRGSMASGLGGQQGQMYYGTMTRVVPYDGDMFMARQFSQLEPYFQNGRLSCSSQYGCQPTSTINPLGRRLVAQR